MARARIIAKEDLVLFGQEVATEVFKQCSDQITSKWHFKDGDLPLKGQTVVTLKGPIGPLLKSERVALNFIGRLSGIATLTRCFANEVAHTSCKILDTRKTTPGFRFLEKKAVVAGGGFNHRMNLSDAVLIKENHIAAVGGLKAALERAKSQTRHSVEVEIRNLSELQVALGENVERLLLDNMNNQELAEALAYIPDHVIVEASGGMTLERVKSVAELGVDFISVGALTHSAPCVDLSFLLMHEGGALV